MKAHIQKSAIGLNMVKEGFLQVILMQEGMVILLKRDKRQGFPVEGIDFY